jgi:hypothetical protein
MDRPIYDRQDLVFIREDQRIEGVEVGSTVKRLITVTPCKVHPI